MHRRHRLLRDPVPPPRGQARQPEADPRQHAARDRLDDRPGADPRGRRGADGRHDLRPRRAARPRRAEGHGRRQAVVVAVRATPKQPRSSPPNELVIPRRPRTVAPQARRRATSPGRLQRDPHLLGPRAHRQEGRHARPRRTTLTLEADEPGHVPRAVRGVLRAVARQHALPGDRASRRTTSKAVARRAAAVRRRRRYGTADEPERGLRRSRPTRTRARTATSSTTRRSVDLRPEPHPPRQPHARSPAARYELNRENLTTGSSNAPSMIPMESKDCRAAAAGHAASACRRSRRTRRRASPTMTQADAETIVDFLLGEK